MSSAVLIDSDQFEIKIPEHRILHRLGYGRKADAVQGHIRALMEEERSRMYTLIRPQAVFSILDYAETNRHAIFAEAVKVALCICTIGEELESFSTRLISDNEMLRGFMLDSFGSEAAEEVAHASDRKIAELARKQNLWPSKRFSPGYGVWDIREQKYLFDVLPAQQIGVRLSDSYMMIPRKSVSFRINFFTSEEQSTRTKY